MIFQILTNGEFTHYPCGGKIKAGTYRNYDLWKCKKCGTVLKMKIKNGEPRGLIFEIVDWETLKKRTRQ